MIVPGFERGDSALSTPQRQKRHFTHFYSEVICMYYSLCYCCLLLLKCHWWIPRERSSYSNSFAFQQHFSISYKPSKLNINQLFLHIFSLSINCRNRIGTTTLQTETSKANRSSGSKVFFFITMTFVFLQNDIPVCKFQESSVLQKKNGWGVISKCDSQNNWELWKLFSKWICLHVLMRRELQIQCQLTLLKIRLGVYVYKTVS